MSKCPFPSHALRDDLPPLTPRIAKLPVDKRGYPVPYFVVWIKGEPEFRLADAEKRKLCIIQRLCWVCGEPLRGLKTFPIGPMCAINRVSSEPPSHPECAEWSARGCPFLSKPQMKRREDEVTDFARAKADIPGFMIDRNPGVTCLWTTKGYKQFSDGKGGKLMRLGEPESLTWYALGRLATRDEVLHSMKTGLPTLLDACRDDNDRRLLNNQFKKVLPWLPA